MDITQLRYFLKAAETLNYTRAADSLFISRQALRQALTALERELGQTLFENDRNHLSLTPYGQYLLVAAREQVEGFDRMVEDVSHFFHQRTTLRFAHSVSLSPYMLPGLEQFVLPAFSHQFPQITLQSEACTADEVIDRVESRQADCGCVLQLPTDRPGCEATVLRTAWMAIASGETSPFFGREKFTLEDLPEIPLIGMGSLEKIAKPLWEECSRRGLRLNYRPVPDTIDALYQMRHCISSCFTNMPAKWGKGANAGPNRSHTPLEDYTWEVVLLCPVDSPNHHAAQMLCAHLSDHYRRLYVGRGPEGELSDPPL